MVVQTVWRGIYLHPGDSGGLVVDLTPGQRVVLKLQRSDGVEVEVELTIIASVEHRAALCAGKLLLIKNLKMSENLHKRLTS